MKFKNEFILVVSIAVMVSAPLAVNAGVFKCEDSDSKISYQPHPCAKSVSKQVEIKKRSAEKDAEAAADLQAWEYNYAAREAAKREESRINMEKEQEYRLRAAEVDAANRQARALENEQTDIAAEISRKLNNLTAQQQGINAIQHNAIQNLTNKH